MQLPRLSLLAGAIQAVWCAETAARTSKSVTRRLRRLWTASIPAINFSSALCPTPRYQCIEVHLLHQPAELADAAAAQLTVSAIPAPPGPWRDPTRRRGAGCTMNTRFAECLLHPPADGGGKCRLSGEARNRHGGQTPFLKLVKEEVTSCDREGFIKRNIVSRSS